MEKMQVENFTVSTKKMTTLFEGEKIYKVMMNMPQSVKLSIKVDNKFDLQVVSTLIRSTKWECCFVYCDPKFVTPHQYKILKTLVDFLIMKLSFNPKIAILYAE